MSNTAGATAQLRDIDWKGVTLHGAIMGTVLAVSVLAMAYGMTAAGRFLGWPESMIRLGANVGVACVSIPFILQAVRPLVRMYRGDSEDSQSEGHTLPEISIAAMANRRRHYTKQLLKAAFGVGFSLLGAVNVYFLVTMRSDVMGTFQSAFGSSATVNYQAMVVMMAFMSLLGAGITVRAWLNRFKDDEEAVIDAMEGLEQ